MTQPQPILALALAVALTCAAPSRAVTLKVIADTELRENGTTGVGDATDTGSGTGTSINARWIFSGTPTNRNEWIALKFDLSAYPDKSLLTNVALRNFMFRANANNSKNLRIYALTPGVSGEDWNETTVTYGSMPGFTFDGNSNTNILDVGGALQNLGSFSVSGVTGEGNISLINPGALTTLVKGMGTHNLLTLLVSFQDSSTGQWRIASREATATETSVLTGPAGSFSSFLQFDVTVPVLAGDYNGNGIVDTADYTVWRDRLGGTTLANEEVSPGLVDIADYLYWTERFGATGPAGSGSAASSQAIPEPASAGIMLIAALILSFPRSAWQRTTLPLRGPRPE